jgi:protein gp37
MAKQTRIEWADHTFNPWRGCTKVSPGCAHCYAETMSKRNPAVLGEWGPSAQRVISAESGWERPLPWNRVAEADGLSHRVFCASLADVFEHRPELHAPRQQLFGLIEQTPMLDWQLLTKRPENIEAMLPAFWPAIGDRVWLGVSIEANDYTWRADYLRRVDCAVRFVSNEPALGPLDQLDLTGLEWIIFGGESGPHFRTAKLQLARDMKARCEAAGVAFFFKQSSHRRSGRGTTLDGETVQQFPLPRRGDRDMGSLRTTPAGCLDKPASGIG